MYGSADPDPNQNVTDPQHWMPDHWSSGPRPTLNLPTPTPLLAFVLRKLESKRPSVYSLPLYGDTSENTVSRADRISLKPFPYHIIAYSDPSQDFTFVWAYEGSPYFGLLSV
jgi:hypothetical protein